MDRDALNFLFEEVKDDSAQLNNQLANGVKPTKTYSSSITKENMVQVCKDNPLGFYDPTTDIFNLLKSEGAEFITIDDVEQLLVKLGGKEFENEEREFFLQHIDINNNGVISLEDFEKFLEILDTGELITRETDRVSNSAV